MEVTATLKPVEAEAFQSYSPAYAASGTRIVVVSSTFLCFQLPLNDVLTSGQSSVQIVVVLHLHFNEVLLSVFKLIDFFFSYGN